MNPDQLLRNMRTIDNRLFERIELVNIHSSCKKPVELYVKPRVDGLIYTNKKQGFNIIAFVDNETGLLRISNTIKTGNCIKTPHQEYHDLAVNYAREQFDTFYRKVMEDENILGEDYKSLKTIKAQVENWFDVGIFDFFKDLHRKLTQLPSVPVPLYNEYIRYQNDSADLNKLTSVELPYMNPMNALGRDTKHIDKFLDVFFEEEDKHVFSWYMGAVMSNVKLQNDNVSKLLFVHGKSGCGKSSLAFGLGHEMLSNELIHIGSDFDSYFSLNNRFSTSSVSERRLSIYDESKWGIKVREDLDHPHDFTGLNTNAIQSLITDGYMDSERKFEHKETTLKSGLHVILTNHFPKINNENEALRRRLIPCLMKDTSMFEKAQILGLEGHKFRDYIRKHALDFAVYFVNAYNEYKGKYKHYVYNHADYIDVENDESVKYENAIKEENELLDAIKTGFDEFVDVAEKQDYSIDNLLVDIERGCDDVRVEGEVIYINSSKLYISSISKRGDKLRAIMNRAGSPVKKFGKRMFMIKYNGHKKLVERLELRAEAVDRDVNELKLEFVEQYSMNKNHLFNVFGEQFVRDLVEVCDKVNNYTIDTIDVITDDNVFEIRQD